MVFTQTFYRSSPRILVWFVSSSGTRALSRHYTPRRKPRNYLFSISKRKGLLIDFGLAQGPEEWQTFLGDDYEWDGSKIIRKATSSGSIRNSDECQADVDMSGAENVDPSRPKKRGRVRRANNVKPSNGFKSKQSTKKVRAERAERMDSAHQSTIYVTPANAFNRYMVSRNSHAEFAFI